MATELVVLDGIEAIGRATLERLAGPVVAVSGGSTYEMVFPFWNPMGSRRIEFLPVDERRVELADAGSNWARTIQLLLEPNGLSRQAANWAPTAAKLDEVVRRAVPTRVGQIPSIPQVWLGMGGDGHTASLFPNGRELTDTTSLALDTISPIAPPFRSTLGLAALRAAGEIFAIVTGKAKGPVLRRALDGDRSLPFALALEGRESTVFVDTDCARAARL